MTKSETDLLVRELGKVRTYFEYGAGESTKLAALQSNVVRIVTAESDPDFLNRSVMSDEAVRRSLESGRLEFAVIDIGPTGRWGRPVDKSQKPKWSRYPAAISSTETKWDLVLVDGLFRVACVATALSGCSETKILVHDFWRRKRYRPLLSVCRVLESADEMVLLDRKPGVPDSDFEVLRRKYETLPADKTLWMSLQSKLGVKV